jgi:IS605 OrfB family transposase
MNEMTFTYQTRLNLGELEENILKEYASLLSHVEHALYAEFAKGKSTAACKNEFLKRFDITARQFNACRVSLDGKIAACQAGQELAISTLKQQIETLDRTIKLLAKKASKHFTLHQKKRRLATLKTRLEAIERDKQAKRVRLCFGSKKLFRSQFYLEKNGFKSHVEWKEAWEARRKSEFFLLGSKDETSGNQSCSASLQSDGKLSLRLRLPKVLEKQYGKYLFLKDMHFAYGQEALVSALAHPEGQAISYRFKKDDKGWRVFASTAMKQEKLPSVKTNGSIGLDLNSDHIAYIETDRFGNIIEKKIFSWISYGKTKEQLQARTGDLCKEIVNLAKQAGKPIVIEKLDFQRKKLELKDERRKFARLLSSFAYGLFFRFLTASTFRHRVALHLVNPAFTSVIGRVNYATRYGLSIHLAAALCIARRYLNFSERPSSSTERIPDGKGGHVAFVLPVRNRTKHVWHFWRGVKRKIPTVLAAHKQARNRSSSPPGSARVTANSS